MRKQLIQISTAAAMAALMAASTFATTAVAAPHFTDARYSTVTTGAFDEDMAAPPGSFTSDMAVPGPHGHAGFERHMHAWARFFK